jgi:ankyrin repeat protein
LKRFENSCVNVGRKFLFAKQEESTVNILLEAGADVNKVDDLSYTPLHYAATYAIESTGESIVKALLEKKPQLNIKTSYGYTPLMFAAQRDHYNIVKLRIAAGADKNVKNYKGKKASNLARTFSQAYLILKQF